METKPQLLTWVLLLFGALSACQGQKATVFVDQTWNREYAKMACDTYKHNYEAACIKTPEQMANELRLRLASAVLQSRACKNVAISYELVSEENMKDYLGGWSLTLNIGIDGRDIDYSRSVWSLLDNKTKKRFDGPLGDSVGAATQICLVATSRGSSVSE
jgi:hypothetical protein